MTEHEHEEENIITLTDENGEEFEFEVIDMLKVEGSDYAILLPLDEAEEEDGEAIILKVLYDEQGEIETLENIEDDEEWEKVADAWQDMVEQEDAE